MDTTAIRKWAEEFVADLSVGGETVPLARVVTAHLETFRHLRATGLTWVGITSILTRAGGRQKDGRPISVDRLRAEVSRASQHPEQGRTEQAQIPQLSKRQRMPDPISSQRSSSVPPTAAEQESPAQSDRHLLTDGKDLSDREIAAALSRIKRS